MTRFNYYFKQILLISALFVAFGCSDKENEKDGRAVVIYDNAVIYTAEDDNHKAEVMVVYDDKIEYVGNKSGAEKYRGKKATVVDLKGKIIIPGMVESHSHPATSAVLLAGGLVAIDGEITREEVVAGLKELLKEEPDRDCIIGAGFGLTDLGLPAGETPTAADLDAVSSEIPILLYDDGLHSAWANSKMLEMAGINENTPDPVPGTSYFVRYPGTNIPTGYMYETVSHELVQYMPFYTPEKVSAALEEFLDFYSSIGFTALFDASVLYDTEYETVSALNKSGKLNQYYQKATTLRTEQTVARNIDRLKENDKKYTSGHFYCNVYKMFEDGTVEIENAATFEPYTSGVRVDPFLTEAENLEHITAALTAGYNVHIHAIGDKAQQYALDAFVKTKDINPHLTRTIAHNQMFEPNALEKYRLMKDNLFCQSTPSWTLEEYEEYTIGKIGEERFKQQYLWGQVLAQGVQVTFGSDYPANILEDVSPFVQMYYAVMRGIDPGIAFPPLEAGVAIEEALKAYTIYGARQLGLADVTGSLKAGKYADFVVIGTDIMEMDPRGLREVEVEQTYFQGKRVY